MSKKLPLSVLIVDDHRLFRQGLVGLLCTRPDLVQVVGEAATGKDAVSLTDQLHPDLVLMDISMPGGSGIVATETILQNRPETAVVMLTSSDEDKDLQESVRVGAAGYLLKDLDANELFDLIAGVARGEAAMTRMMAAKLLKGLSQEQAVNNSEGDHLAELTERELEVLRLVARGVSNPDIATALYITVNTVKTHISNILNKLQVDNRTQAATYAVQQGLITPFNDD
jgi:DNA-binding NarL/FixJ family response regulator